MCVCVCVCQPKHQALVSSWKELELHLDGDGWDKMILSAQLFAPLHHTYKPQQEPYSICVFLNGIAQRQFKAN